MEIFYLKLGTNSDTYCEAEEETWNFYSKIKVYTHRYMKKAVTMSK